MTIFGYCVSDEDMAKEWEDYGYFPLSGIKSGERVLVYCKECKRELLLDEVIDHMLSSEGYPLGHKVHFTIEKE